MSGFKKAPKKKGLFGTYNMNLSKEHAIALAALGVVTVDPDGKASACELSAWWWLSDLCDDRNVHLGEVLECFGHAMTCVVNDLSKTKEGERAIATLRSYWAKEAESCRETVARERAVAEALEREFAKPVPNKAKKRAA